MQRIHRRQANVTKSTRMVGAIGLKLFRVHVWRTSGRCGQLIAATLMLVRNLFQGTYEKEKNLVD